MQVWAETTILVYTVCMMQLLTSILVTLYIPPTRLQAYKEFRWLRPASVVGWDGDSGPGSHIYLEYSCLPITHLELVTEQYVVRRRYIRVIDTVPPNR